MAGYRSRGGGLEDNMGRIVYIIIVIAVLVSLGNLMYFVVAAKSGHKFSTADRNIFIFMGVVVVILAIMMRVMPFMS